MSIRTPLASARGLGSSKSGVSHWWAQRVSAAALVPLTLWFVICLINNVGADYSAVVAWLSSPIQAVLMVLYLGAIFYHSHLGLQVVAEDYIHTEWIKTATVIVLQFANILLGVLSIVSVLMIALGAAG